MAHLPSSVPLIARILLSMLGTAPKYCLLAWVGCRANPSSTRTCCLVLQFFFKCVLPLSKLPCTPDRNPSFCVNTFFLKKKHSKKVNGILQVYIAAWQGQPFYTIAKQLAFCRKPSCTEVKIAMYKAFFYRVNIYFISYFFIFNRGIPHILNFF